MSTPQVNRLTISKGPALVTRNGAKFLSQDDITLDVTKKTVPINSSAYGKLFDVVDTTDASLDLTPVGQIENLTELYPYASTLPGTSIFGSGGDVPLLIQPLDTTQKAIQFAASGLSKMPDLTFKATSTIFGPLGYRFIGANNVAVDDPARLFSFLDNTLTDTGYDDSLIRTGRASIRWLSNGTVNWRQDVGGGNVTTPQTYKVAAADLQTALNALTAITAAGGVTVTGDIDNGWVVTWLEDGARALITGEAYTNMPGGVTLLAKRLVTGDGTHAEVQMVVLSPWANFPTQDGIKVSHTVDLSDQTQDGVGVYDVFFNGLTVQAEGIPLVDWLALMAASEFQGPNSVQGSRLTDGAHDLYIQGNGIYYKMFKTKPQKGGGIFGREKMRAPSVQWNAARVIQSGSVAPLFQISTTAIADA